MAEWLGREPPYGGWITSPRSPGKSRTDPVDHREVNVAAVGMDFLHERDPLVFAAVPVLLFAVTLAAAWTPAARATRVDPMEVLRHQ